MPRPKPPEVLKPRYIRLSDSEFQKLQKLGGAEWLRRFLGGKPARYYEVFKRTDESRPCQ
jgi:hypothetical protein